LGTAAAKLSSQPRTSRLDASSQNSSNKEAGGEREKEGENEK
jgi:hypothetical protein